MLCSLAFRSALSSAPTRAGQLSVRYRSRMSAQPTSESSAGASSQPTGGYPSLKEKAKLPARPGSASLERSAFELRVPIIAIRIELDKIGKLRNHPVFKE